MSIKETACQLFERRKKERTENFLPFVCLFVLVQNTFENFLFCKIVESNSIG